MDRDHRDTVTGLIELVGNDHPAPRTQNEPQTGPATLELRPETRELPKHCQGRPYTLTSVRRKGESDDQAVEILDGRSRQFDRRHELQIIERDRLAGRGLP